MSVRWQSKTPRGKVAWRAGTTIGLLGYPDESVWAVWGAYLASTVYIVSRTADKVLFMNIRFYKINRDTELTTLISNSITKETYEQKIKNTKWLFKNGKFCWFYGFNGMKCNQCCRLISLKCFFQPWFLQKLSFFGIQTQKSLSWVGYTNFRSISFAKISFS